MLTFLSILIGLSLGRCDGFWAPAIGSSQSLNLQTRNDYGRPQLSQLYENTSRDLHFPEKTVTGSSSFSVIKEVTVKKKESRLFSPSRWLRKDLLPPNHKNLTYTYSYDKLMVRQNHTSSKESTVGIVLIHPIGVGIARWFHERLFKAFAARDGINSTSGLNYMLLSPDLLGSGSASDPQMKFENPEIVSKYLPLLNISDWTEQLIDLMSKTEDDNTVDRWCLVANGGCSPIALQIARRSLDPSFPLQKPITNVIISSSPRLSFFLTSSDSSKVAKAYSRLCGVIGRIFWWYACRKDGKFVRKFSEKNLIADPSNLGDTWQSNCYKTAIMNGGKSRYSTFAFLAGALQDGCQRSLNRLRGKGFIQVDIIKGKDGRRNKAKSWFWQRKKRVPSVTDENQGNFREFIKDNGNGGNEAIIGGRISLAHEDAVGYCESICTFTEKYGRRALICS